MRKLLASASFVILGSASVFAGDFPMKAQAPVFNWSGCYIGAHAGGGSMHDSYTSDSSVFFGGLEGLGGNGGTGKGAIAGGQIGCNYQDGSLVYGIEGEGSWSDIKTKTGFSENFGGIGGPTETVTQTTRNKSNYSVAGRVGYAFDRTLVYGKAGWAWGQYSFDTTETASGIANGIGSLYQSGTLNGLLLGVGLEHAFTPNWTLKVEYNYIDYGSKLLTLTECAGGACGVVGSLSEHASIQTVKVGVNYLFNGRY